MADELPDWHVVSNQVRKDQTLAEGGTGLQTVWSVPYMIDSGPARGSTHTVEVSTDDFTPARVKSAIEDQLSTVHGVTTLRSGNAGMD